MLKNSFDTLSRCIGRNIRIYFCFVKYTRKKLIGKLMAFHKKTYICEKQAINIKAKKT